MENQEIFQDIINHIRAAIGLLDFEQDSQLRKDAIAICDHFDNPIFRITVFGPFNYGKSTLLNALLGEKALPIDLIPTTGAAIYVRYGRELQTKILLKDGTEISEPGTKVLKRYAILDDDRRMRDDVASVEISCPHPFLQTGVEFMDLPGTNDREAQNALVRDKLLTADLIIQVLDSRKLMTLGERENLRDWLLDRGIKTVIFAVNFMNLLEPEEQKEVSNRMRFVAESFRAELPTGISNLYRIDALPALRARLKGDMAGAQTSGLGTFESALQNITSRQREKTAVRFPRVEAIARRVCQIGAAKRQAIATELETAQEKQGAKLELQQKAEKLIKQGLQSSSSDFQSWLYLPKLLDRYQLELAKALELGQFSFWEGGQFKPAVLDRQRSIVEWLEKARDILAIAPPEAMEISFPDPPQVSFPEPPSSPTMLGKVFRIMAENANVLIDEATGQPKKKKSTPTNIPYSEQVARAYADAARDYLTRFSSAAFSTLAAYQDEAEKAIVFQGSPEPAEIAAQQNQLYLLDSLLENIERELTAIGSQLGNGSA